MATERLSMRKAREILRQKWELDRTHREIAASVGQSDHGAAQSPSALPRGSISRGRAFEAA